MRNKEIYSELADALSIRRGHVPVVKCDEFYALLKELWGAPIFVPPRMRDFLLFPLVAFCLLHRTTTD